MTTRFYVAMGLGLTMMASPAFPGGFQGGQGTINVNSWSPDSKHFACVTFQVKPAVP